MKKLLATLSLTIAVLLGSVGVSESDGFDRGERAYKNGDYATAMREFKLIAEEEGGAGAGAQYLVGRLYAMGKGVPKDYKAAFKWFKLAAEGGDLDAHKSLGQMYFNGMGVPQDHQMALKWYKRPAERGHADAQIALGGTYAAIEDYIAAYMWNEIAAKNKQKNTGQMRNLIESKMAPHQIAQAKDLARECIRKNYKGCSTSIALPKKCDGSQNFDTWTNCFGVQRFPNLTTYVGGWKDGKRHGQGTLFYGPNRKLLLRGSEYVGEWKDDKRHGQGTHTYGPKSRWPGNKYVGEYRNGKRHGQGTLTFASGGKYVGGFKNGKLHGQGTLTNASRKDQYGKKQEEKKYVGEYRNGKKHGQGTLTMFSGHKYVGGWKNGKKHGQGTLILPDGQLFEGKSTIEGIYENGKLKGMSVSAEPIDGYCLKETPFSHSAVAGKCSASYAKGDYETALQEFQPFAEEGSLGAQINLGYMYDKGKGVPKDYKAAFKWYRLAAEQGYAKAQYNLGVMYDKGKGVPKDYKAAFKWFKLAAEQGNGRSRISLGDMYLGGKGVPQDYIRGYMWRVMREVRFRDPARFKKLAPDQKKYFEKYEKKYMKKAAEKMTPDQIAKAEDLARECVKKKYKGC